MAVRSSVTVMVEDRWIAVDGLSVEFRKPFSLAAGHERLWALHWKGGKGEYQLDDPPENIFFNGSKYGQWVQPYVDQWEAEKARQEAEEARLQAEAEAEWNKPENVAARAREERDKLLAESDFILMPDYPASEEVKAAWTAYRQALRDLPEQEGWPMNIVWPEKPSA